MSTSATNVVTLPTASAPSTFVAWVLTHGSRIDSEIGACLARYESEATKHNTPETDRTGLTVSQIADLTESSAQSVRNRVHRMIELGILREYAFAVDTGKVGNPNRKGYRLAIPYTEAPTETPKAPKRGKGTGKASPSAPAPAPAPVVASAPDPQPAPATGIPAPVAPVVAAPVVAPLPPVRVEYPAGRVRLYIGADMSGGYYAMIPRPDEAMPADALVILDVDIPARSVPVYRVS